MVTLQVTDQRMDWRFSTFLIAMLAILFGFTWAASEPGMCGSPYVVKVLADHTKDGALNCFDFWFNRYQTMLTGFAALIAAIVAVVATRKQVGLANKAIIQGQLNYIKAAYKQTVEAYNKTSEFNFRIRDFQSAFIKIDDNYLTISEAHASDAIDVACKGLVAYARNILLLVKSSDVEPVSEESAVNFLKGCEVVVELEEAFRSVLGEFFFLRELLQKNNYYEVESKILNSNEWRQLKILLNLIDKECLDLRQAAKALRDSLKIALEAQTVQLKSAQRNLSESI
ncbi:hypothetical protein [Methylobacterium sp. E-045]|uniref:hypothetical protein n=1 Tax=Methylobacterium sp. E-045 TaxID=2836575 RepID=UPI001FBA488B|nr:hypothetical protein [Methylobacterium sp. E-045]MCJ2128202.1 hypothetical protein [Methylobacterium sp. E-045]